MGTCKKKQAVEREYVIFRIVHASGKFFISGATDLDRSWRIHRSRLRAGVHGSADMQLDWNRTGEGAFRLDNLWEGKITRRAFTHQLRELIRKLQPEYNAPLTAKGALISFARYNQTLAKNKSLGDPVDAMSALPKEVLEILQRTVLLDPADPRWPKIVGWANTYWQGICVWDDQAAMIGLV